MLRDSALKDLAPEDLTKVELESGTPVVDGWFHIPLSLSAEAIAHAGFGTLALTAKRTPAKGLPSH